MTLSLRQKMILRVGLAVILILVISGIILNLFVSSDIQKGFDARLLDGARLLESEVVVKCDSVVFDLTEFHLGSVADKDLIQLTGPGKVIHFRSPELQEMTLPVPALSAGNWAFTNVHLDDGVHLRCVHLAFHPHLGDSDEEEDDTISSARAQDTLVILTIGRNAHFLEQSIVRIRVILIAVAVVTFIVLILALLAVIGATLGPVEDLAQGIAGFDPGHSGKRFAIRGLPREFYPVVDRLNDLLLRLQATLDREKTFSADFSHEIRTPLAGLQSTLEVGLLKPRTPREYEMILQECLGISGSMQSITQAMLTLKRLEYGATTVEKTTFPVRGMIEDLAAEFTAPARQKAMSIQLEVESDMVLHTDRKLFELAVRNIIDNAISHGEAGSTVTISGTQTATGVYIEVANPGCGLSRDEAQDLRARFRRGDKSRAVEGGHTGLGLALVDGIGKVLDFSVVIDVDAAGYYRIRFEFKP